MATSSPGGELVHPAAESSPWDGVTRFDVAADNAIDRIRGPVADRIFTTASRFGEFSIGWIAIGIVDGLVSKRPRDSLRLAALIGAESLVVNQGIKRLFRRARPDRLHPEQYGIRRPITSSFPSGHASSAFYAATLLTARHRRLAPLWFGVAILVAVSRPYTRMHHASDVVAGAATGLVLGQMARRVWSD
jgi:membrane-associated phospholipid phosphatase